MRRFNAALSEKLSFNFVRDIAPVASISRNSFAMLAHTAEPPPSDGSGGRVAPDEPQLCAVELPADAPPVANAVGARADRVLHLDQAASLQIGPLNVRFSSSNGAKADITEGLRRADSVAKLFAALPTRNYRIR
jgi:hypothetical protein